ncbi:ACP S-malonyltransferase [Marinilongibacter aquaticus]|uniref:ACP S-malonyltransferase n=1 Tax=Marinilongibacter aquaticus TaxID=2975157 RepID=UPI0021BD21C9|nr:ACP S-malonyltransferase [Marinilongibacter aquaticus]UBM60715.1 ACP S-malonyltransferase [Marinilongibacter aquaticus]
MKAYVFPGQGAQFSGMGQALYEGSEKAKALFQQANEILGFEITKVMFEGSDEDLKQTNVTQPAVFLHSVIQALVQNDLKPDMVAGHSLGEFSALVVSQALSFEDALKLVAKRAGAMQEACEINPSTMAAVLRLDDQKVEEICAEISNDLGEVLVAANYNCPGQLVISGTEKAIDEAIIRMKEAGAKRALKLPVSGAFHSPLMEPAREKLAQAIQQTTLHSPICPIYQNATARPSKDIESIKNNLIVQLTAPVKWTQSVQNMVADGASEFIECGPGKVLQGLVAKIAPEVSVSGL